MGRGRSTRRRGVVTADPYRHRPNPALEATIAELTEVLTPTAELLRRCHRAPEHPTVLVHGCPRSGTTVTLQWLVATGALASPSNVVARFPTAPWLGAVVHRLLLDPELGIGDEMTPAGRGELRADLGKTSGPGAVHECWGAWRHLIPPGPDDALDAERAARFDTAGLRAMFGGLEAGFAKPVAAKALIMNWNVGLLAAALPDAAFLRVRRDPHETMASIWRARRRRNGDATTWWSFRPPGSRQLERLPVADQIAAQVRSIEDALDDSFAALDPHRRLELRLEDLIADPEAAHERVRGWLGPLGVALPGRHPLASTSQLGAGDPPALPAEVRAELRAAWDTTCEPTVQRPPMRSTSAAW